MGIKEFMEDMRERRKEKKEVLTGMAEQMRAEEILTERKKSANERELQRFFKENREEQIKVELEKMRKIRDEDIKFGHNSLNTPNVTVGDTELLKAKNLFKGKGNIFSGNESIHKNNHNLLRNERWLMK